jgi:aspartyl protease family protein
MRSVVLFSVFALAAALVVPRYAAQMRTDRVSAPAASGALVSATSTGSGSRTVAVLPNAHGHFLVDARIAGDRLTFMIDTGASVVAISESAAARLGIHPAPPDFVAEVRTANGTVRGARAHLDSIEVGDLIVRDVAAVVLPDRALRDNLLGLSFLSRLHRFEYSDGKLVLEQ